MHALTDIGMQNIVTVGVIVVGAILAFWLLRKIVKFLLSLVIVAIIAAAAVIYCVKAGYISREAAEKLNPLNSEQIRQTVRDAGAWAGAQAKDAAKKAIGAAMNEAIDGSGRGSGDVDPRPNGSCPIQ